jgi:formylglycine-generating enzyme required for sulfatase activity
MRRIFFAVMAALVVGCTAATQAPDVRPLAEGETRVEEPVRTPPVSVGALPAMVRVPGRNFEVGRTEVTFAQWDACVVGGGCNGYRPGDEGWGRGNQPVITVSWNDAQAYVQWLSQRTGQRYRLLTSEEWEIAARAGTTTNFSWGDQDPVCDQSARNGANFSACTDDRTRPVGSFQPNGFGLYDVHGNVWEWVEDAEGSSRVLRGGSWDDGPQYLRWAYPESRYGIIGFRVARTV